MLFGIIRFIIMFLIIISGLGLVRRSNVINKRRLNMIIIVLSVILGIISCFIPFENAFITFSSPEKAFKYSNTNDIYTVVEGSNSALVVSKGSEGIELLIVPKVEDRWKISVGSKTYSLKIDEYNTVVVNVLKNEDTGDCYLSVNDINGDVLDISDSLNSQFYCVSLEYKILDRIYNYYYSYIGSFEGGYEIIVNGQKIEIN